LIRVILDQYNTNIAVLWIVSCFISGSYLRIGHAREVICISGRKLP